MAFSKTFIQMKCALFKAEYEWIIIVDEGVEALTQEKNIFPNFL